MCRQETLCRDLGKMLPNAAVPVQASPVGSWPRGGSSTPEMGGQRCGDHSCQQRGPSCPAQDSGATAPALLSLRDSPGPGSHPALAVSPVPLRQPHAALSGNRSQQRKPGAGRGFFGAPQPQAKETQVLR